MSGFSHRSKPRTTMLGGVILVTIVAVGCIQGGGATTGPSAAVAPSAATTQVMGKGMLHEVDGTASGEAQLVVKPDGSYVVVLESFKIESIAHTNVILVSNSNVAATGDIDKSKLLDLGPLKATEGMQDFPIPAAMATIVMEGYHSVVIWDTEMAHAVAAASLK